MLSVGNSVTHAAFLNALTSGHGYTCSVESYFEGELVATLNPENGAVRCDTTNRVRRSINNLTLAENLWPTTAGDALSPQGIWLRILITVTSGTTVFPAVPVFAGKCLRVSRQRRSGKLTAVAADPMWQVNREAFERPRAAPVGTSVVELIRALLREVFPEASLEDQTGSNATVPTVGLVWDAAAGSRGRAVDELAAAIGAEVFARPTRVWPEADFVVRPVPRVDTGTPDWTLTDGPGGVVEDDQLQLDGEPVINRWVVLVEPTTATGTLYAVATDDSASSPTHYGGPMGRLVEFYSSPFVGTLAQGGIVAAAKLARSLGMGDARTLRAIANPALEGGDLMAVGMGTETVVRHIVDRFELPLSVSPATMAITTRSAVSTT